MSGFVTPGRRGVSLIAIGFVALGVASAAILSGGPFAPTKVDATAALCRNVATERGLAYRGAYGTTPFAQEPMAAMMLRNMGNGAAVADVAGDGGLSVLLLGQLGHPNRLFRNQLAASGEPGFKDVTESAGLANDGGSRAAAFADLDDDGHLDLIVMNDWDGDKLGSPSRIFRNKGDGTFADVTTGSGFAPVGYLVGGLSLADYDRDGLLDIFVTYWTMELGGDPARDAMSIKGRFPGQNRLFRNLGGFTFRDVTTDVHLGQTRADIFYENVGGSFRKASDRYGVGHVGNDMGIAVADLDSDATLDLYVTNITDPNDQFGTGSGNTLLIGARDSNGDLGYVDDATTTGVSDTGWGWGTAFTDMDLDGRLDLYVVQGMQEFIAQQSPQLRNQSARLFRGTGARSFEPAVGNGCDIPGDQRTVIPLDYDRDGAPDLLITQVAYSAILLENQTTDQHWLTVDLSRAGAQAAGARVTVSHAGLRTTQVTLYGGSYLAGMPLELYFGLGAVGIADDVTVTWADGSTVSLGSVAADQVLRLTPVGGQP